MIQTPVAWLVGDGPDPYNMYLIFKGLLTKRKKTIARTHLRLALSRHSLGVLLAACRGLEYHMGVSHTGRALIKTVGVLLAFL